MLRTASSLPLAGPPACYRASSLAATRTGLPPAGDDKLANTRNTMALRHGHLRSGRTTIEVRGQYRLNCAVLFRRKAVNVADAAVGEMVAHNRCGSLWADLGEPKGVAPYRYWRWRSDWLACPSRMVTHPGSDGTG